VQRQGQNTLWNLLRRAVSRRTKRHIELMIKKKKILIIYQRYVQIGRRLIMGSKVLRKRIKLNK